MSSTVSRRLEVAVVSNPLVPPHGPDDHDDPTGIRALLGGLPNPGPMPPDLVARINASIAAEQSARSGQSVNPFADPTVVPLRRRPRWQRFGLAAAVAAVAAIGLPALLSSTGSSWMASLTTHSSSAGSAGSVADSAAGAPVSPKAAAPPVTIYASGTAYTSGAFATEVQRFLDHPGTPLAPLTAESPHLGPAATPLGLAPCVAALGLDPAARLQADLGTFDGAPAVMIVVGTDTGQMAYAVGRGCTAGATTVLAGPVRVG
jgi:hypothetical protein